MRIRTFLAALAALVLPLLSCQHNSSGGTAPEEEQHPLADPTTPRQPAVFTDTGPLDFEVVASGSLATTITNHDTPRIRVQLDAGETPSPWEYWFPGGSTSYWNS